MTGYIRLAEAPVWCIQYPTCSECGVELDTEGDGWTCPVCGTQWDMDAGDGDKGTLFADWAGEEATGPVVKSGDAMRWGIYHEQMARHRRWPDLYPHEPKRPAS